MIVSIDRQNYKSTISSSKFIYYNTKIDLKFSGPRILFKIEDIITSPPDEKIIPILPNNSNFKLGYLFEKSCHNKIAKIID